MSPIESAKSINTSTSTLGDLMNKIVKTKKQYAPIEEGWGLAEQIEEEKDKKNEGKKRFKRHDGIGKAKYTISYHDGKKKHKDGSDFFDIKIFKNKPELEAFKKDLVSKPKLSFLIIALASISKILITSSFNISG